MLHAEQDNLDAARSAFDTAEQGQRQGKLTDATLTTLRAALYAAEAREAAAQGDDATSLLAHVTACLAPSNVTSDQVLARRIVSRTVQDD